MLFRSSAALIAFVHGAARHTRRMTSVCSGAFALAAAGLLDDRRATTHWRMAAQLQRRYPRIKVQSDHIFIHDGPVWTSAGISAGIDLALALIEEDLGVDVARAVARELDGPVENVRHTLAEYAGVDRRFQKRGEAAGVTVVDDYWHHPTEIRATLAAARSGFDRRIVAVFQPHRYSRVADLFRDFVGAFADADEVLVTDIYSAGESALEGIDACALTEALGRSYKGVVRYLPAGPALADEVTALLRPGDLLLTLGAGDITRLGREVLARLPD